MAPFDSNDVPADVLIEFRDSLEREAKDYTDALARSVRERTGDRALGGPGSGDHGHAGRPGAVGGSAPGFATGSRFYDAKQRQTERQLGKSVQKTYDQIGEQALRDYVGHGAARINRALRSGKPLNQKDQQIFDHIQHAAEAGKLPAGTIVYRGVNLPSKTIQQEFRLGRTVTMKGLISTSLDPEIASTFSGWHEHLIEIKVKHGVYIGSLTSLNLTPEREVILPHRSKFKVVKITHAPLKVNGRVQDIIQLEQR